MTYPLLSLASGVLPEFTPQQVATAAIAAGWPAVGIWVEPSTWTKAIAQEVRALTKDAGLDVLDVEVIWIKPGPDDPDHFRIIDAGAEIGARHVLVVSSEPDPGAAAARFGRLCDHAAASGLRACLEFGAFTAVRDLAAALDVLARAGRPEAGLLIDPLHLRRTGGAPADLRSVDPHRFPYAQICDAAAEGPPTTDVRVSPGAVHAIVRTHPETGYNALYLGRRRFAYVMGLEVEESEDLLNLLWAHATRPELHWHHTWKAGDMIVWDNACLLHHRYPIQHRQHQ